METGLAGKRALVAGGASGIGRAIVLALEEEGVAVAVADRNESDVGRVRLRVTLGDDEASSAAVEQVAAELGGLDLLVHTTAVARHEPVLALSSDAWHATVGSNLSACVWTCRVAANRFVRSGGGAILVIGSTSVYTPAAGESAYRASKAALKAFVEVLAIELAPASVRVNLLTPGAVETPLTAGLTSGERSALLREIPLARQAVPAELTDRKSVV